jgi:hypothetical protein
MTVDQLKESIKVAEGDLIRLRNRQTHLEQTFHSNSVSVRVTTV